MGTSREARGRGIQEATASTARQEPHRHQGPPASSHASCRGPAATRTLELLAGAAQQLVEDVEAALVLGLADGPRLLQQIWVEESRCRRRGLRGPCLAPSIPSAPLLSRKAVESFPAPPRGTATDWLSGLEHITETLCLSFLICERGLITTPTTESLGG